MIGKGDCSAWAVWKPCSSFLGCVIAGLESAASQPTSVSEAVNGKHAPAALTQQTCMGYAHTTGIQELLDLAMHVLHAHAH